MSLSGSKISYLSGTKNNWRRWAWNRITELPGRKTKDRLVLFLGSPNTQDLTEALRRGYAAHNLIAIERNAENTKEMRRQRITTINAHASTVLQAWPDEVRVDALFLDFCCGIDTEIYQCILATTRPAFRGASVMVNMQRGRDSVGIMRRAMSGADLSEISRLVSAGFLTRFSDPESTNRAQWLNMCRQAWLWAWGGGLELGAEDRMWLGTQIAEHMRLCKEKHFSYRHSRVFMDSVVYLNQPVELFDLVSEAYRPHWEDAKRSVRTTVSAALAIRTMRKAGKLKEAERANA